MNDYIFQSSDLCVLFSGEILHACVCMCVCVCAVFDVLLFVCVRVCLCVSARVWCICMCVCECVVFYCVLWLCVVFVCVCFKDISLWCLCVCVYSGHECVFVCVGQVCVWCVCDGLEQRVVTHQMSQKHTPEMFPTEQRVFVMCCVNLLCYFVSDGEKTACERHRESALAVSSSSGVFNFFRPRPAVGQYVPTCDSYGAYEPTQCHAGVGQCWCVDDSGAEIPGSRTTPGSRPMCKCTDRTQPDRHSASAPVMTTNSSLYRYRS